MWSELWRWHDAVINRSQGVFGHGADGHADVDQRTFGYGERLFEAEPVVRQFVCIHKPQTNPSDFKWRHFRGEIILWAVRWYCKYGISYRDLEEMLCERGVDVDHTTIYRWVQHYAPVIEKRLRWYWKRPSFSRSWRVDETYVKVKANGLTCIVLLTRRVQQ